MLTRRQRASRIRDDNDDNPKKQKVQTSPIEEKTRKGNSVDELITKNDLNTTSTDTTQNGLANAMIAPEITNFYTAINHVLTMKYANVVERLHLTFPAKCTQLLQACSEQHIRNSVSFFSLFSHNTLAIQIIKHIILFHHLFRSEYSNFG